jgi:hypothetical protein
MPKPVLRLPCSRLVIFKILIRIYMFWPPMAAFMATVLSRLCPTPQAKDLEEPFRHEVFKMLKAEGKINDVVIENMMNPASGGTDSTCTAATLSGRTMKRVWKIWRATSSEPPFLKSA